jgi:hypothetical protein
VVVHRIDLGIVWPVQLALELQVVGRVGEDQVDALRLQRPHHLDAVSRQHNIARHLHDFSGFLDGRHRAASRSGRNASQDESKPIRRQTLNESST